MAGRAATKLGSRDAIKTYRYLRIGMIGAVVLLASSIVIEHDKADCWQTSVSAYYYTPVRAIFVGSMIAVGFSLIVIKGRGAWEDTCLNFAGLLAPVVAVLPTTDVGKCWSIRPRPLPVKHDGSLANWVVTNIDNNFNALLLTGAAGILVAFIFAIAAYLRHAPVRDVTLGTTLSLAFTALALLFGWWLFHNWDDFNTRAHGFSALAMFVFLIGAVGGKAFAHRQHLTTGYFPLYSAIALLMALGGIAISTVRIGGEHTVFVLEAYEIVLFAVFWIVQTAENWNEEVAAPSATSGSEPSGTSR